MSEDEGLGLLAALELKGIGPAKVRGRLNANPDVPREPEQLLHWLSQPPAATLRWTDVEAAWRSAESRLVKSRKAGIRLLTPLSVEYPPGLAELPDAPVTLWYKGSMDLLSTPSIAVVGTRHPSMTGATVARRTGRLLAKEGITVVSGLATGCDSEAHIGATSDGGQAVGVLAHGLDDVRPAASRPLAKEILNLGGVLVSEYAIGTPARPENFVQRNRIQVGLSEAIVVVETGRKGGTMHTVQFARNAGRLIGVWVPSASDRDTWSDDSRAGNRALLEEDATIQVETPHDLADLARRVREAFQARRSLHSGVPCKWRE